MYLSTKRGRKESNDEFRYIIENRCDKTYIADLKKQMTKLGWKTKDHLGGNVGYDFINQNTVLVDYGSEIHKI